MKSVHVNRSGCHTGLDVTLAGLIALPAELPCVMELKRRLEGKRPEIFSNRVVVLHWLAVHLSSTLGAALKRSLT